ncbi:MAG: Uma2 family endonuclease [Symploca sp. SIO3C6]|nr:Uma2 family endonuclease [Symploca sp. SIO3C6]
MSNQSIQFSQEVNQVNTPYSLPMIQVPPNFRISHEQFIELAGANRDIRLERTAQGELIIMSPTYSDTGASNAEIGGQLWSWNNKTKLGIVFDSSTGFHLPNGATRSPDASWISLEQWNSLIPQQRQKFASICPDFVVELRSQSDSLVSVQRKMHEYLENGLRLGWLIDKQNRKVEIYQPGEEVKILNNLTELSGGKILPGFILDLSKVWS